jgi:hypothetical protein
LNQRPARRLPRGHGRTEERGGKHVVTMTRPGRRPITVPHHGGGDHPGDLAAAIVRQAGLTGEGSQWPTPVPEPFIRCGSIMSLGRSTRRGPRWQSYPAASPPGATWTSGEKPWPRRSGLAVRAAQQVHVDLDVTEQRMLAKTA